MFLSRWFVPGLGSKTDQGSCFPAGDMGRFEVASCSRGLADLTLHQKTYGQELSFLSYLSSNTVCLFSKALCGCTVNVPTLDGRTIPVVFKDVIRPGMRRKVPGEGLPLPKTPEKRGDLIIEFEVIFPERIPQTSRTVLEQVLPI